MNLQQKAAVKARTELFKGLTTLPGGPRSASAEAVERSVLLVVTRAELLRLLSI